MLAPHQRLTGDEGSKTDYDSLLRRKRDSAVNGGIEAKFNGVRGVDGAKWADSAGDVNNSEFPKEEDNVEQSLMMSNDEEVPAKRKWSENNVRIWGKRKWSSKGLHMWGKRKEDASHGANVEQPMGDGGKENGVRDWPNWEGQQNQMYGWGKDGEEMKKRQRWAKNNLKMWGKRNAETEVNAEDLEEARLRALESADPEEEHLDGLQGTSPYGNRISGYLQKRNNPPNYGVEQKWGKKGWANNNVRIWG